MPGLEDWLPRPDDELEARLTGVDRYIKPYRFMHPPPPPTIRERLGAAWHGFVNGLKYGNRWY